VRDRERIDADDAAAHRIDRDLVVAHDHEPEVEGDRREHASLAGRDRIDRHELWLDHVLQVGDLAIELVVMIEQAVAIVLDADVVLEAERDGRPRVRLELRAVHEEVGLGHGLRREQAVAQALWVIERDLDLRDLLEMAQLDAGALGQLAVARIREREARRHRDARALADRQLAQRAIVAVPQRPDHALDELRARVGVWEARTGRDDVGLDQRTTLRAQVEPLEAVAHDAADALGVVLTAVAEDDRGGERAHAAQNKPKRRRSSGVAVS
jgi:hypothetical protein